MRGFQERAEVAAVVQLLTRRLRPLAPEAVDLHAAWGRVLAVDVTADRPVPSFDRAAMDGYALRSAETLGADPVHPVELEVVGEALPGWPCPRPVQPGQAVRIMTGAPVPEGADAVIQAEAAAETAGRVRIMTSATPGRHIGRRGEDLEAGSVVLRAGRVLRPQDVGALASLGVSPVPVIRRPTVSILVTGDELLPCGSRPEGFRIVDSNSVMLEALVRRDGGLPDIAPLVPDRAEAVRSALLQAPGDVVLVSGGSSVGQEDHAPRVLAEVGELSIHGMALRPAGPAGIGFLGERPVFLLPGNPVACLCAYDLFAGRALRRLGGRSMELPYATCVLPLARDIPSVPGRVDYVRVRISNGQVEPLATRGASNLSSVTRADGFVLVDADADRYAAGALVTVYLYDPPGNTP
ncbi:MAG: molybdopterin molybdotransferase MoeA [Planctomycetes bacterium]|nr:molybdopterin molybdotransferase MoeA [Planctomycetota bacterium]